VFYQIYKVIIEGNDNLRFQIVKVLNSMSFERGAAKRRFFFYKYGMRMFSPINIDLNEFMV